MEDEFDELLKKQATWPFTCVIDGIELQVGRPSRGAIKNAHYSGEQYALNVLLGVCLDGVIIYCSDPTPKMHDQAFWLMTGLHDHFIGKPYSIIGDGGFQFNYARKKGKAIVHIHSITPTNAQSAQRAARSAATLPTCRSARMWSSRRHESSWRTPTIA